MKTIKTCFDGNAQDCWYCNGEAGKYGSAAPEYKGCTNSSYAFIDNSGTAWYMYDNAQRAIIIDVNADKAPNQLGRDRFVIQFIKNNIP